MAFTTAQRPGPGEDELWAKTRAVGNAATQVMGDEESYLATTSHAIGRRIDNEHHELFVVCAPAEALQLQFQHHAQDFIVLHDVGIDASQRLLQAVAGAMRQPVQQLVVRRQGFGVALATLRFVELPAAGQAAPVRIYSSRCDCADEAQATALAQTLLAHSRLGVVLVGAQALADAPTRLKPLREAMTGSDWRNRQMLWLPIGADAATVPASLLAVRPGIVQVHSAPVQADVVQAWPVITGLWDRVRRAAPDGELPPSPFEATMARPGPLRPAPAPAPAPAAAPVAARPAPAVAPAVQAPPPAHAAASRVEQAAQATIAALAMPASPPINVPTRAAAENRLWQDYVRECAALPGMISCCVFELATERSLAHAGNRPGPAALASQGAALYEALAHGARTLGLAPGQPEMALTLAEHHLILHPLSQHPGLVLHAVLDAHLANLTLVRMKLHRLDPGGPFTTGH